ncbi:kinase-like domain-containing protein [Obelidium mucronatum]|nr:kinase-like domain-containing protein [Obelidium mucronatum]
MERALTCLRRASEVSLPPGTTAPPTKQNSAPPQWVLTSWEIDIGDTVAQGGFAEVLKATWLNHTTVAVKRLHMRLETSKMRDDFLREVKTWFPLRHPHILPLLGACATAERPFMVMPFMPRGHSLQYLDWCGVNQGKDCVEAKGIKLLYEVSLGLQYLHSRGVVHGDLKAVNILVDEHGSANVADFGFASLKQFSSTRNTSAGGSNHFGGTLRWMSPERLLGGRLAPPVDVYAFAMTCYEILSEGEVPMTEIPDALLYQHIVHSHLRPQIPQPSASTTYANTSKHLFRLMKACWDPNPLARPSFSSIAISMKSITTEARGKGSTVENIATAASESYATIRDPVPSVSDSLFRVDQHYQYMSQESDGSNSGIIGLGGGMLTKTVRGTQQHPFDGDDINLEFEPGTWGALGKNIIIKVHTYIHC